MKDLLIAGNLIFQPAALTDAVATPTLDPHTVEECAQVADRFAGDMGHLIAAAIRALTKPE